ncbi:hypothetical protein [Stutzerimonas kunmingensis]|uniref:hypothetical protein n=1 Tax=Stutzerimonas kunmingensis TaxID=1211807 RepID=UPI00241C9785|nr:hypothetical protein [Stutzerimonas kunmingensis]
MHVLHDRASIARLDDLDLRTLIEWRIRQIETSVPWDSAILGPFILVEPGDSIEALVAATGISAATDFEFLDEHVHYYEALWIISDDGYGVDLFIPKRAGIDPTLLAMCAAFAVPVIPAEPAT